MADIDNFFAKKDKKKKGNKKFSKANPDVIAQKLERTARKEQMQQEMARDINNTVEERAEEVAQEDDEEWEQYRVKDFTGLKIEKLVMEEKEIGPETGEEDTEEVKENREVVDRAECWTRNMKERSLKEDSSRVEIYTPPGRRASKAGEAGTQSSKQKRMTKEAPDINSSIAFPDLSSLGKKLVKDYDESFVEVRGRGSYQDRKRLAGRGL